MDKIVLPIAEQCLQYMESLYLQYTILALPCILHISSMELNTMHTLSTESLKICYILAHPVL